MPSYVAVLGDTFESVSRKEYGVETFATRIRAANPGVEEPIAPGTVLNVPAAPGLPNNPLGTSATDEPDEVALTVDNDRFRFWDSARVTRSLDTLDSIAFTAPFDPDDAAQRDRFRPFSYKAATFSIGGEPLFTGTIVSNRPQLAPDSRTVTVAGYSLPGVLNDCTPSEPTDLEFNNVAFNTIVERLLGPFGLASEFDAPVGAAFERVKCESSQRVLAFLVELARQRNGILNSTPAGALRFTQSSPVGVPVVTLEEGVSPLTSVTPLFNEQQYYSSVTGIERASLDTSGGAFTVRNPRVEAIRPYTFAVTNVIGGDVKSAVEAQAGRMFASAVSYQVEVNTWRAPNGELWQPDQDIALRAPSAMVYDTYVFKLRSVAFDVSKAARTATLELVLPGAFSGQIPESMPWD